MQQEDGKDGVRFTSITRLMKHGSKAVGEEERPHLQGHQAREVPKAGGDGAGQLVDGEVPAAVGARGQDHETKTE